MTNDVHLRKERKGSSVQWLAVYHVVYSVGKG